MKEPTIVTHLRRIRAAINWAVEKGLLPEPPRFEIQNKSRGKLMRGRPICAEEFERMLAAVDKVRKRDPQAWKYYLNGLWLSGLRLEESLILSWDQDEPFCIDLGGRHPRFRIYAEAHKSGRDILLPMTPDFARFILQTPESEQQGAVFPLGNNRGGQLSVKRVCRYVSEIGRAAGVIVNSRDGKFASAHDLRRSFGTRWSSQVKPPILMKLMRHASLETTMRYYVDLDCDEISRQLWREAGHISGHIGDLGVEKP